MNFVAHAIPGWLDMSTKAWQYPSSRSGLGRARNCSHLAMIGDGEYSGVFACVCVGVNINVGVGGGN